jgi:hypothetical protein
VALAAVEIAVGVAALTIDHAASALAVSAVYTGFGAFVWYALRRRIPIQSCGCFGRVDTPPSTAHLALDGTFALAGFVVAYTGSLAGRLGTASVLESSGVLVVATIGAYVSYLLLAELPTLMLAVREIE